MKKTIHTIFSPDIYKLVLFLVSLVGVCPLLVETITPCLKLLHIYAAAVIVFDLLGERRILKNRGRTILAVFVLCYCVTIVSNPELLSFSDLSNFAYFFACLALVYSYGEGSEKWARVTSDVLLVLTSAANVVGSSFFYSKYSLAVGEYNYIGMYPSQNRLAGLFGNPNVLGMVCLAMICLAFIRFIKSETRHARWLYGLALAVNLITLLLANSRTQILSFCALCAVYVFMRLVQNDRSSKRVVLAVLAAVLTVALVFGCCLLLQRGLSFLEVLDELLEGESIDKLGETIKREKDDTMFNGRVAIWLHSLKAFVHKPLFGCGMDNIDTVLVQNGEEPLWVPGNLHNSYLEALTAFGIAGVLCLAAFVWAMARDSWFFFQRAKGEKWRQGAAMLACVAAFMVDALADSTLMASVYPTSTAFFFLAGQYMQLLESENDQPREEPVAILAGKLKIRGKG